MRLILCGSARCVWDDIRPYYSAQFSDTRWMAVNDIGMHLPVRLSHWYSNSADRLKAMARCRRENLNQDVKLHAMRHPGQGEVRYMWDLPGHGTSALNACYVGLKLEFEEIVLCGIPLDDQPYYFEPDWIESNANFVREVPIKGGRMKWWENARDTVFEGRVRSMSGRTRELLG